MRLILAAIAIGLGYIQYLLPQYGFRFEMESWGPLLHIVLDILLLATASILIFSFFRVDVMPDGQLCYNPNNPYWKLMKYFYSQSFKSRISLCKAYWATVGLLTLGAVILLIFGALLTIVGTLSYTVYDAAYNLNKDSAVGLGLLGIMILCIFIIGGVCKLLGWFEEKLPWFEYVNVALRIIILFAVGVALPIYAIHAYYVISYGAAALVYLKLVGLGTVTIAGVVFLIWAAFKYFPIFKNTWVGYILRLAKKELCPQLIACPVTTNRQPC